MSGSVHLQPAAACSALAVLHQHTDFCLAVDCPILQRDTCADPPLALVRTAQSLWGTLSLAYAPILEQHPSLELSPAAAAVPDAPDLDVVVCRCREPLLPLLRTLPALVAPSAAGNVRGVRLFVYELCASGAPLSELPPLDVRDRLFRVHRLIAPIGRESGRDASATSQPSQPSQPPSAAKQPKAFQQPKGRPALAFDAHLRAAARALLRPGASFTTAASVAPGSSFAPAAFTLLLRPRALAALSPAPEPRAPAHASTSADPHRILMDELEPQWTATEGAEPWMEAAGVAAALMRQLSAALSAASGALQAGADAEAFDCFNRSLALLLRRERLTAASRAGWRSLGGGRGAAADTGCFAGSGGERPASGDGKGGHGGQGSHDGGGWPSHVSRPGFCGVTNEGVEGDCNRFGSSGSWNARLHRINSLGECAARCLLCEHCRFVTYSRTDDDCSWYSRCDLERLGQMPGYYSLRVRARAARGGAAKGDGALAPEAAAALSAFIKRNRADRSWQLLLLRGSLRLLFDAIDAAAATVPSAAADPSAAHTRRTPPLVSFRCVEADFVFHNRELLPEAPCAADPDADEQPRLVRQLRRQAAANALRAERLGCSPSSSLQRELHLSGFASMVSSLLKPLTAALRLGRAFLTPLAPGVTDGGRCAARDLSCFFRSLGPRCERTAPARRAPELRFNLAQFRQESAAAHAGAAIPRTFRAEGAFWWSSRLLAMLMEPAPPLAAQLEAALRESGLGAALAAGEPVLGLHVRHGDACLAAEQRRTRRRCEPLGRYVDAMREYALRHGVRTVFLATDSEVALAETRRYPEFKFIHIGNVSRSGVSHDVPNEVVDVLLKRRAAAQRELSASYDDAMLAALDTLLLSRCQLLVGKFTSGLFRAAYALASARAHALPPYLSLDAPWCSDYQIAAGRNFDFPFRDETAATLRGTEQLALGDEGGGTWRELGGGREVEGSEAAAAAWKWTRRTRLRNVMANAFQC